VREPDCYGAIDIDTGRSTLFVPRLPDAYAVWMGKVKTNDEWRAVYEVDEVRFVDELAAVMGERDPGVVYVLHGFNTDGKAYAKPATFKGIEAFRVDNGKLWPHICELRTIKTPKEVALLRYVCAVTSEAHIAVMQHTKAGHMEYQLESVFHHWCRYHGGCRHMSYTCICASGHNGSVLHYGHAGEPNAKRVHKGDFCLFDMGTEYHCYGSDVTTTFPADSNGKFTADQLIVYRAVLAATYAVEDAMAPGVSWRDMQTLAYRTILTHLRDGGVLTGDVDAMMAVNLGATFMPHGLGHFLGIDTHDVGGYPKGFTRPTEAGYASLRTVRPLQEGNYITVEPGCYFIDMLLDAALADPTKAGFINADVLKRFRGTGGVRIEDDVLVTATGCENLTWAPRTVEDIEACCAGKITSIKQITKYH
jgi:Xaa-Pro dipeptidase